MRKCGLRVRQRVCSLRGASAQTSRIHEDRADVPGVELKGPNRNGHHATGGHMRMAQDTVRGDHRSGRVLCL